MKNYKSLIVTVLLICVSISFYRFKLVWLPSLIFFYLNIYIRGYSFKLTFCKGCIAYLRFSHAEILQSSMADVLLRLYRMLVPFTFEVDW